METFAKIVGTVLAGLILAFGLAALMAFPTMWLVNGLFAPGALMAVFGAAQITFWKSFALNLLCGILFQSSSSSSSKKDS